MLVVTAGPFLGMFCWLVMYARDGLVKRSIECVSSLQVGLGSMLEEKGFDLLQVTLSLI